MFMRKKILILLAAAAWAVGASAQEPVQTDTVGVCLYFRQGYSRLELSYRDNGERLDSFVRRVRGLRADTLCRIRQVRIVGSASPEGLTPANERLSRKRSHSIDTLLQRLLPDERHLFRVESLGIDWQGLERMVEASDMPWREEVLHILRHTPEWIYRDGKIVDGRKRQLGMLRGGQPWFYMERHFFPRLRAGGVDVSCVIERLPQPQSPVPVVEEPQPEREEADTAVVAVQPEPPAPALATPRPFYMAVKTNLLYDAALVPNLGVEFYLKKGWSLSANWMYAWWKSDRKHRYWRVYGGDVSVRKYLGRRAAEKPLTGHHLGLYGQILTYDLEWGGRGYLGDRWNYAAGLEYGYSWPVARRLNLDFAIGVGYLGGEYKEYVPMDNHYVWQATKQRHWFGPTKAEVSLVWLLGRGNVNAGKGGKR